MKKATYIFLPEDLYYFLQRRKVERQQAGQPFALSAQITELVEAERKRIEAETVCTSDP